MCYLCPKNKGRNEIYTHIFSEHIKYTHPKIEDHYCSPPNRTIIIESMIYKNSKLYNNGFHQKISNTVGNDDVSTWYKKY